MNINKSVIARIKKPHGDNKVNITNASATCLSKVKPTNGNRKLLRIKSNIHVFVL